MTPFLQLLIILSLLFAPPARAQDESEDNLDPQNFHHLGPNMKHEALERSLQSLPGLSDDQRIIIETTHEDYLRSHFAASADLRRWLLEGLRQRQQEQDGRHRFERPDLAAPRPEFDPMPQLRWKIDRANAERAFADQVAAVLEESQQAAWASIVRSHRRAIHLAPGDAARFRRGGEIDLTLAVAALDLPQAEQERISEVMLDYEMRLDEHLREYEIRAVELHIEDTLLRKNHPEVGERGFEAGTPAAERSREIHEWYQSQSYALVRLNFDTHDRLIAALPHHRHEPFREEFGRLMFPELYRTSPAEMLFVAMLDEGEAPPELISALEASRMRYRARRQPIYDAIVNRERRVLCFGMNEKEAAEWQFQRQAIQKQMRERQPGEFLWFTPPSLEPWRKRFLLNQRTCREIRGLFSEAEFENLPAHVRLLLSWQGP